jgi:hypothetical protein
MNGVLPNPQSDVWNPTQTGNEWVYWGSRSNAITVLIFKEEGILRPKQPNEEFSMEGKRYRKRLREILCKICD